MTDTTWVKKSGMAGTGEDAQTSSFDPVDPGETLTTTTWAQQSGMDGTEEGTLINIVDNAELSADEAAASASEAAASAFSASTSAQNAVTSESNASDSELAASVSAAEALASETAAGASETASATSASQAATSASQASTSASNASASAIASASSASAALASETAASVSESASLASETAAALSESNASASESAAALSESSAAGSASSASTSASQASTSATNAASSASAALTSETNAATSESNAASSASAALASETNASASESAAATSEANALASETAAGVSESNAATSETNAATSASQAATSASNAAASESAASTSATNSASSASASSTSASNAAASESAAAVSESNAATSETNASSSASAASSSASAASASAATASSAKDDALAALDSFDDRYLGAKASDPALDNDGDALLTGALYYNTTVDVMKVYDGAAWGAAYASIAGITLDDVTSDGNTTANSITVGGLTATGDVILNADPSSNLGAATKQYVDTIAAAGLHYHDPVRVEKEGNLAATYDNGSSGVGATLTNSGTQEALVIDGVTLSIGDRVLIYEQTNQAHNGVYTVTDTGSASTNWVLTRATDADSYAPSDPDSFGQGDAFYVQEGTWGAGELYVMTTEGTITFGTTNIHFSQISSAQVYSGGTGIDVTGTTISSTATLDNVTTNNNSTTNAITVGGVTSTGSVTAPNLNTGNWDTAYSWGNHASVGYLTGFTETDPTVPAHVKSITTTEKSNWNTAYGWGNHAVAGYLPSSSYTAADVLTKVKTVDGAGSGLDADTLDGQQGSYYYPASNPNGYTDDQTASEILTAVKTVDGSGSGLDADLLDGVQASQLVRSDANTSLASGHKWTFHSGAGGTSFGANHYSMGVDIANGGWAGPNYSDLIIGYHTGIRIGANYSGIRFYNNSPTTDANNDGNGDGGESLLMTIGGASGIDVTINNDLYVGDNVHVNQQKGFVTSGAWTRTATPYGYIDFGPANASYAHIYTDRPNFYLNKNILINDSYVWHAGNDGSGSGLDADLLDGLHLHTGRNNEVNKVVRTDGSGYIQAGWINTPSGNMGATGIDRIYCSNDDYIRYQTPTYFRNSMISAGLVGGITGKGTTTIGFASTANSASGFYDVYNDNTPSGTWYSMLNMAHSGGNHGHQIAGSFYSPGDLFNRNNANTSFSGWTRIWNAANDGSGSGLDADLLDGHQGDSYLGKIGTSYYQANNWIQLGGEYGLYCPTINGAHFYPNNAGSYGAWRIDGTRNSYTGIYLANGGGVVTGMFDASGNGGEWSASATGGWHYYYHRGNRCMGVGAATTSSAYGIYEQGGGIYSTGNITAYSDRRVKENIRTIDNALETVEQMRGVYYNRIDDEEKKTVIGFIAQEVDEIEGAKPLVTYAEDVDQYGVSYGNTTALLVEAIKELSQQVKELQQEIKELKNA